MTNSIYVVSLDDNGIPNDLPIMMQQSTLIDIFTVLPIVILPVVYGQKTQPITRHWQNNSEALASPKKNYGIPFYVGIQGRTETRNKRPIPLSST